MNDRRHPPHDPESERAVLGSCLLDPEAFAAVSKHLRAGDFYTPRNTTVWRAMQALAKAGMPIDATTLRGQLDTAGELAVAGGDEYLLAITDTIPTVANAEHHARRVRELASVRQVMQAAQRIAAEGLEPIAGVGDYLDRAATAIGRATEDRSSGMRVVALSAALDEAYSELSRRQMAGDRMLGHPTGFDALDGQLGGLAPGDLIVVAARPGMGKTAFANALKLGVARGTKKAVLSLELEMSRQQLAHRVLSSEAGVNLRNLRQARFDSREAMMLAQAADRLSKLPIFFVEQRHAKLSDFRREALRLQRQQGQIGLVVVDYLQIARPEQREDMREREVAAMSAALKSLAGELQCPVVALSQLNREVEKRQDKRPMLSDLRDSGAVEQDADTVLMLYRDEVYNPGTQHKGICEVIIAKQRSGPIGTVLLRWSSQLTRFDSLEQHFEDPQEALAL